MMRTESEHREVWEERLRSGRTPLHNVMGLHLAQLTPSAVLTMELSDAVRGPVEGTVHGGILATFADVASAAVLWNTYEVDVQQPVTTDMHVRYYRQPRSGPLTAEATVVHKGKRLLGTECVVTDAELRVLVRSTATYMIVPIPSAGTGA
jgi:uncharacterized protein (TIGR00369 family)